MHVRVFLSRYARTTRARPAAGAACSPRPSAGNGGAHAARSSTRCRSSALRACRAARGPPRGTGSAGIALDSIMTRLRYLGDVGLGYLTPDRASRTLSGGEVERVNLTGCLGTSLVDTLFVMDEPSVGLHPRDIDRLVAIIRSLVGRRQHGRRRRARRGDDPGGRPRDRDRAGAGRARRARRLPGTVRRDARGPAQHHRGLLLGPAQDRRAPGARRPVAGRATLPRVPRRRKHNIRGLDVRIPLRRLVCLSGVSGSGKSTLLDNVIHQGLLAHRGEPAEDPAPSASIRGADVVSRARPGGPGAALPDARAPTPPSTSRPGTSSASSSRRRPPPRRPGFGRLQLLLQRRRRPLRPLPGAGLRAGGDAVPLRRLRPLPRLRGAPVQARGPGDRPGTAPRWRTCSRSSVGGRPARLRGLPADPRPARRPRLRGPGLPRLGQPLNTLSGGESQRLKLVRYLGRAAGGRATPSSSSTSPRRGCTATTSAGCSGSSRRSSSGATAWS